MLGGDMMECRNVFGTCAIIGDTKVRTPIVRQLLRFSIGVITAAEMD